MFESVLCVKYVSTKTCFVYLSSNHKNLNTGMCIKLAYGDKKVAYFSSSIVRNNVDVESIGINSAYAKLLGIEENTFVNVSQIEQVPVTNSITIQPYSKPDYEVLEMLAQNVQSNLLDQVRVVNSGQNLVIWIGNSITVKVIVDNVQPMSPGILDFLTEVIIKSPEDSQIHKINEQKPKSEENLEYMKDFVQFLNQNSLQNNILIDKLFEVQKDLFYRLIPISELPIQENILDNIFPFTVFLARNGCKDTFQNNFEFPFYSMTLLNSPYLVKKVHVKLYYLEDIFDDTHDLFIKNNVCNIFVNNTILNFMQCEFGARVVLKKIKNVSAVKEIEVHSKKNYKVNIVEKVKIYLSDDNQLPIILNANFPVEIDDKLFCSFKFLPTLSEYCIVDSEFLRNCSYTLSDEEIRPIEPIFSKSDLDENFCSDIASVRNTYEDIMSVFCIKNKYHKENLIITDVGIKNNYKEFLARPWIKATYYLSDCPHKSKPGMGKSSFLNYIGNTFRNYPYFVNTEILNCKKIKGKTPDSLHKLFTDIFNKLVFCQPSLLILDDLHVLCESCEGEETPNTIYFNRVSEMLYGLFSNFAKYNSIGILISVESVSKLNKNLYRSRGNHLFKNIFALEDLNKADRILLLKHFFKNHLVAPNIDYTELSIKTDGFVVQDIKDFYQKVIFEAYKESHKEDQVIIRQDHCDIALKKSCALSLQNVKFHSDGAKSFDDIGGLREVKSVLIESLLWPVKYSSIFANAPLRLQSGLLLYGPPGTGKTLLAGAAAKQCSLRLISIKGPELLSKYIGASEQAVRDVFEKAQRAKPCILFFDEFDSLAPRRGHDNTGVTDRVVNQLLTQLDGVEALTGVCVLAATSRPDLLDPALLRPGRLDKQLLCPMPDKSDRLEILQILAKKLDLSDDVNLDEISLKTEGYSGADLQSMLYTAQISSVTDFEPNDETKILTSKIDQTCLLEALEKTRPSLAKSERLKYDIIYTKFRGGNLEDFKAGSKVTLA